MESRIDCLSVLPDEKLLEISDSFSASDYINFPNTSSRFSLLFFAEHNLALNFLRQLLSHAALGEWEDAEKIWKLFPDLLTCRGTVYHPNPPEVTSEMNPGRPKYVNRTAWQIAWMNEEYEEVERMAKYMSDEEKQKQFAEIFPDGKIVKYNWDLEEAKKRLDAVFDEVIKDPSIHEDYLDTMSESTRKAWNELHAYVKPAPEHHIGLVSDVSIYVEALKSSEDKSYQFNGHHLSFWCIRVEEILAACLGTAYLRPHAQGIENKLKRIGCVLPDGLSYHPFRRPSSSVPGSHFFVECSGLRRWASGQLPAVRGLAFFEPYVKQIRKQGQSLCSDFRTHKRRRF